MTIAEFTFQTLFLLLCGHALGDFALQSEWMAINKNRHAEGGVSYLPPEATPPLIWPYVLSAHALIHGGIVALITGSWLFGIAEVLAHWSIDFWKNEGKIDFHTDQALHILCKVLWTGMVVIPLTFQKITINI